MPYSNVTLKGYGGRSYTEQGEREEGSNTSSLSACSVDFYNSPDSLYRKPMMTEETKYDLEDYIYEMESRVEKMGSPILPDEEEEDIYTRLSKKEKDLILAAELGKALLERNEHLVEQNEKLAEDYSHKLEILEQEKHTLRRKLAATESEYELKIQELSSDIQTARDELEEHKDALRLVDREKSQVIEELTEQNQRLTAQLKETSKREDQLMQQIQQMRDQYNLRRNNLTEQSSTFEILREEINLLADQKMELERRVEHLMSEREGLSVTLDESSDRILMLEKRSREQELMLRSSQRDLEDVRHNNTSLTDRLEAISRNSSSPSMGHASLMNEMDTSDLEGEAPPSLNTANIRDQN